MRFVIYDDESLEPITVLNLPLTERDALGQRVWRVPVPEPLPLPTFTPVDAEPTMVEMRVVELTFEPFRRHRQDGRLQRSVICFTKAADLAMLLNPDWLPGQRSAIQYLQDQNDSLTRMLMRVF